MGSTSLLPLLPAGTALDPFDGKHFVSLVGFLFEDVRVKGMRIPLHVRFEEVNLRFYVTRRQPDGSLRRGVVFIREFVPKRAISFVANTFYGEAYRTVPMRHKWLDRQDEQVVAYRWRTANEWMKMQVSAAKEGQRIVPGSAEEFITEHYWGYTKLQGARSSEYEVVHPKWMVHPIKRYDIAVDFGVSYGARWGFLTGKKPDSIFLADGSEISVRTGSRIEVR